MLPLVNCIFVLFNPRCFSVHFHYHYLRHCPLNLIPLINCTECINWPCRVHSGKKEGKIQLKISSAAMKPLLSRWRLSLTESVTEWVSEWVKPGTRASTELPNAIAFLLFILLSFSSAVVKLHQSSSSSSFSVVFFSCCCSRCCCCLVFFTYRNSHWIEVLLLLQISQL